MAIGDPRGITLALLDARAPNATICPSEIARAVMGERQDGESNGWRDAMPIVHAAIDRLLADGHVRLRWKGRTLTARAGPYRIGRG